MGVVPCETPGARIVLSHHLRLLIGVEALRLQCIIYPDEAKLAKYSDAFLWDLAGNAFNALCYGVVKLAVMTAIGVALQDAVVFVVWPAGSCLRYHRPSWHILFLDSDVVAFGCGCIFN